MRQFFLIVIAATVFSCSHINEGTVIQKWYEPGREYTYTTYVQCGKVMIPIVNSGWDDEDYMVTIKKGKKEADITMVKEEWEKTKVGDYVRFEP